MRSLLLAALFLLAGCGDAPGEWSSFVYADRHHGQQYLKTDGFHSLAFCREQAIAQMKAIEVAGGGDYLCGRRCGPPREPGGPDLCQETSK